MNRGYVLVWRKIQDSGLMQMPNTLAVFLHLLFSATHKDIKVGTPHGVIELKRGQYISGRKKLAEELEQSERQIRTSLDRLVELKILTIKSTTRYSVYTIENYSLYQDPGNKLTNETTNERPTNDQRTTTKQTHNTQNTHKNKTSLPNNFSISERVKNWANEKGYVNLQKHFDSFILKAQSKGYTYIDWDAAFMTAIRDNWANVPTERKNKVVL